MVCHRENNTVFFPYRNFYIPSNLLQGGSFHNLMDRQSRLLKIQTIFSVSTIVTSAYKTAFSSYILGCLHFVHVDFLEVCVLEILLLSDGNQTSLLHNAHSICYELGPEYIMGSHQNGFAPLP